MIIALGLLSLAVLAPNRPSGRVPDEDAGVFLYVAGRLLDGGVPYRDVWDHKPPLIYFIDAAGLLLGGGGLDGVWALEVAALWGASVLLFAALFRELGHAAALFAAAAMLLSVPRFVLVGGQFTNFTELFGLPLQAAALYLFGLDRRPPARRWWHVLAIGLVGGLTLALKPPLLGLWLAAVLCAVIIRTRTRPPREMLVWLAALSAGFVAFPATLLLYFAWHGAALDLWDQVIAYNRAYVSSSSVGERLEAIVVGARYALNAWLPVAAAGGCAAAIARLVAAHRDVPYLIVVALVSLPVVVPLAGASGNAYGIYALPWLPSLAVLAGYGAAWLTRLTRAVGSRTPWIGSSAQWSRAGRIALLALFALMAVRPAGLLWREGMMGDDGRVRAVASYVRDQVGPGERVLLWGSRTEVLVLADRRAPTRFVYQYAPLYTVGYQRPELTEELLDDLRRERPVLIIDATYASPLSIPLTPGALRGWDSHDASYAAPPGIERVIAFVSGSYRAVGTVADGWPVYRLADR